MKIISNPRIAFLLNPALYFRKVRQRYINFPTVLGLQQDFCLQNPCSQWMFGLQNEAILLKYIVEMCFFFSFCFMCIYSQRTGESCAPKFVCLRESWSVWETNPRAPCSVLWSSMCSHVWQHMLYEPKETKLEWWSGGKYLNVKVI